MQKAVKNFVRWLRAVYRWIRQIPVTRHYWWAIAIVIASVIVVCALGWTEEAFRLAGVVLQLLGVFTVVVGILKMRSDFGQPAVWQQFLNWLRMFPPFHPSVGTAEGKAEFPPLTCGGSGCTTYGSAANQSIKGRLEHLENFVKKELGEIRIAVFQDKENAQEALDQQDRRLSGQIDTVVKKVETTATSGVHVSAVGAILLFFGTIYSGAAPELYRLLLIFQ